MSLLRPIIRATAVAALRKRTWAEDRVANSNMMPIGAAIFGMRDPITNKPVAKPYICVYTDTDDIVPANNQIYSGLNRTLNLVLELGVATALRKTATGPITIQFADTDEGLEWACDVISAQAMWALLGDPYSDWGDLFKTMAGNCRRIQSRRGGQTQQGVRFAARRITLQLAPIFDLAPGIVPVENHPVRTFISMAMAVGPTIGSVDDATMVDNLLKTLIGTVNYPEWRQAQALLGLSTDDIRWLNADVPLPYPTVETPPLDWSDPSDYPPPFQMMTIDDQRPFTFTSVSPSFPSPPTSDAFFYD